MSLEYTIVDELLQLNVTHAGHSDDMIRRLARIASALQQCLSDLDREYQTLGGTLDTENIIRTLFPRPSPRPDLGASKLPLLKFKGYLDRNKGFVDVLQTSKVADTRCLYVAEMALSRDGRKLEVLVKFTENYCEAAHRLLANADLAPKLFECCPVIGGCFMVVMELLGAEWKTMSSFDNEENPILPRSVYEDIEQAILLLGDSNFAHGDLRAANVMVDPNRAHAKLIDFDWTCEDGKGRYPFDINVNNRSQGEWSPAVEASRYIRKEHDDWALKNALVSYIKDDEET